MADETKGKSQRVYRRKPDDIAEAKFISKLIDDHVNSSGKQLVDEDRHDEYHVLLDYRKTWRGIVAALEAPQSEQVQPENNATMPAAKSLDTPMNLHEQETAIGDTTTEGGTQKPRATARNRA